ncbi:translocation/assembly module TamB domain-containing protein [Granulicella arctica]|uniref:Translocation and assembly module TamB n=1 Tax=Granulicella arctica TaxID=940613 RepID=A0A7Y9TGC2_9BACT|nr:translocation/assembly module TamB domain-containing protein [Granulicella arctica]NYF79751.1 translocation and assembly module TamB [Granulicella arctica]
MNRSGENEQVVVTKRSLGGRIARPVGWTLLGLFLFVLVVLGGFAWYSTTSDFQRRVGKEVVSVLEDATGGRVELANINFSLWHLAIEAKGLVIHGLEGPGEAPYLSADRILVRVQIVNFFAHAAGTGVASHVGLNLLRVEHPQVHLIIDKDGKTNQPAPKHPSTSKTPVIDTLLDLKARDVELVNGMALLNDKAIPFDLAARDLNAQVQYLSATDRYGAIVDLNDLRTKMGKQKEAQSKLHIEAEVGRAVAELKRFDLHTGAASTLAATGSIRNFAQPEWQATVKGSLELKQVSVLANVDGLDAGVVDLNVNGHSCGTSPAVAQKHPHFWQRRHPKTEIKPAAKVLPPDPDCKAGYLLVGSAKLHKAAYADEFVRLHDIDGGAQLHITPTELLLTAVTGYLPGGGKAEGIFRISNWLGEVSADAAASSPTAVGAVTTVNKTATSLGSQAVATATKLPPVQSAHAYITATVTKIPLRTIMEITAPKNYGDLGFDTSITGPVKVEWGGPAKDVADTVEVDADVALSPTGVKRKGALSDIPVTGQVLGHYTGRTEVVKIQRLTFQTPQSTLNASGVLGVNLGDPLTDLRTDLTVRDLSEYDQLLQTLGFSANGKKGRAAIPVALHGGLEFNGAAKGAVADLDLKGHLTASQLEVQLGTTDVHVDSVVADAEYSPQAGLAVATSTIERGTAVLNLTGTVRPRRVVSRRGVVSYEWDDQIAIDGNAKLANAQAADVLEIVGQQKKIPLTGTLTANVHAVGTLKNLSGGGLVTLTNGVAYGETFESVVANLTVQGQDIEASSATVKLHGMQIQGSGGYDIASMHLHGHVEGDNVQLSKFKTLQQSGTSVDGLLNVVADANGTLTEPGLKANLKLNAVTLNNAALGDLSAAVHSEGKVAYVTAESMLVGAKLYLTGQTQLTGDYQTQAKLTLTGLDVGKPLALFSPGTIKATSSIAGVVTVDGPLATPKALSGTAEFNDVDVKLQGIELKAAEPLRISLGNGVAHLDQVHITGPDTDMHASGTAQLFGSTNPKGGVLDVKANGSVSIALAHTFDPEIISSGKVKFVVNAGGQVMNPALTGTVQFENVNLAMDGIPNGLSNMNGTLVFNEDRLQVQTLTATTGGGLLKIGGFLTYRNGLFANLTATGETVRVRLYGLSATANTNLKLLGGLDSLQLSGNILLTRFGIGPDVDFAAFASTGGVSAPTDPDALSNKIRLDVHITSSPQLDFQNSYAKLAGTVDLTVRGTVAEPSVLGRIQITDGSATFAGTTYQLQRGDIYFSNPVRIDPIIDLDATARVENYDITIGLHGTTTNLKPTYRSEPPLSEADVFALLALGRTQEESQLYQEQQVQAGTDPATSSLLGGALNATVSNRVEKLFGVGSVKIDPAFVGTLGNSAARITVQQQISRQITATFATNVNQSAQELIQVQYNFSNNKSVVVTRDETGVYSVVYKLRERYR